jgi:hypothetical protein
MDTLQCYVYAEFNARAWVRRCGREVRVGLPASVDMSQFDVCGLTTYIAMLCMRAFGNAKARGGGWEWDLGALMDTLRCEYAWNLTQGREGSEADVDLCRGAWMGTVIRGMPLLCSWGRHGGLGSINMPRLWRLGVV